MGRWGVQIKWKTGGSEKKKKPGAGSGRGIRDRESKKKIGIPELVS